MKGHSTSKNTNLHHIWDSDIIESTGITKGLCVETCLKQKLKDEPLFKEIDVQGWMDNSRSLLPQVYDIKDNIITQDYIDSSKVITEAQLAKGGLILALILNDIFK